jgi:hypothetical protein
MTALFRFAASAIPPTIAGGLLVFSATLGASDHEVKYSVKDTAFCVIGVRIKDPCEMSISKNKRYFVYTRMDIGDEPEAYIFDGRHNEVKRLSTNAFIEFNPVVNDNGDYAYAQPEYSTSEFKIYLNGTVLKETTREALYKNLEMNNQTLEYVFERLYDDRHFVNVVDLRTRENKRICIGVA